MAESTSEQSESVLSEHIADAVRASILRGELLPGERIRQEDLATQFKASRFPVREALRILETGGLVTVQANRGARVTQLSQDECLELYKVRERLEPLLLKQSADAFPAESLPALKELLDQLENVGDMGVDEYLDLDRRFHLLTYSAASMESVRSLVERLIQMTHFYRRAYHNIVHASEGRSWILEYDHRLIFDALQRQDGREAALVMRLHTRRARQALKAHPEVFKSDKTHAARPPRLGV